jgi:hypothetical protein
MRLKSFRVTFLCVERDGSVSARYSTIVKAYESDEARLDAINILARNHLKSPTGLASTVEWAEAQKSSICRMIRSWTRNGLLAQAGSNLWLG